MPGAIVSYAVALLAILLLLPAVLTLIRARRSRPNNTDTALTTGFNLHVQSELTETRAALTAANRTIAELRSELERTRTGPGDAG